MSRADELRGMVNIIIRDCCESETSDPARDDTIMIREATLREILERALLTRTEAAPVADGVDISDDPFLAKRRTVMFAIGDRKFSAVIERHQKGEWVSRIYQRVGHRRNPHGVDRQIWPALKVSAAATAALVHLNAGQRGDIKEQPE